MPPLPLDSPSSPLPREELRASFGEIDIYLFDQILKGRFDRRRRLLDAGCGDGRNLVYFLRQGFRVSASIAIAPLLRRCVRLRRRSPLNRSARTSKWARWIVCP